LRNVEEWMTVDLAHQRNGTDLREALLMKNVIEFMELVSSLKELQRTGWKQHRVTGIIDTTASHTFGVVFLSWLFVKDGHVDTEKVLKMALLHDFVESVIGDLTPEESERVDRNRLEENGLKTAEERLPPPLTEETRSLIEEFRRGVSVEARIVRVCDRLETLFQAYFYRRANRLSEASFIEFFSYAEEICNEGLGRELLNEIQDAAKELRSSVRHGRYRRRTRV
jgi:putative hydrolase of HD superfamily